MISVVLVPEDPPNIYRITENKTIKTSIQKIYAKLIRITFDECQFLMEIF